MTTSARAVTLTIVAALVVLGAWLLYDGPANPTSPDNEGAHQPGDNEPPPPVLHGRSAEPDRKPAGTVSDTAPGGALLTVRVLDDERGRAIADADVYVAQGDDTARTIRTSAEGVAEIDAVHAGEVHVVARAPGFTRAAAFQMLGVEPVEIEMRLPRGVLLEGTVVDEQTGLPIAEASVVVVPGGALDGWAELSAAAPFGWARTDERGWFAVDGVPPDELLTARATAGGYGVTSQSMRLAPAPGTPTAIVLRLPPAASLVGSVLQAEGDPAAGARVYAVQADAPEMLLADPESRCVSDGRSFASLRGVADADGAFQIDGLELGAAYIVFAELEQHGRSELKRGVIATEERPQPRVDLVLAGAGSLTVRVLGPDGELRSEAQLSLFGDGFPLQLGPLSPGVFEIREPAPGAYTLRVSCVGAVMQELPVEIRAAQRQELEVRLKLGLVIAGVLVDDTGNPIASQKLWVDRPWQEAGKHPPSQGRAETDEQGRFRIDGLRDGPHTLGLVLAKHVVPDDFRVTPPGEDLRLVVLRWASLRFRLALPPGFLPPEKVSIRIGRKLGDAYGESGHGLRWNAGDLRFDQLRPGAGRVRIQIEGLLEAVREVNAQPGEVADLGTVTMEAGFELEGRVVDRDERPVEGARVTAGELWTPLHREVMTDPDGRFVLPTLAPGDSEIEIAADGFLPRAVSVVMPGQASGRAFILSRGSLVTVRVSDTSGAPTPARYVQWRRTAASSDGENTDSDETDAKGQLQLRLPAGQWTLELLDKEWEPVAAAEVDLTEGGSTTVEFTLRR